MTLLRPLLLLTMCAMASTLHTHAPVVKVLTFNFTGPAAETIKVTLEPGKIILTLHDTVLDTHATPKAEGTLEEIESDAEDVSTRTLVWIVLAVVLLFGMCSLSGCFSRGGTVTQTPGHFWAGSLTQRGGC
jgi:hypothetical protein